MLSSAVLGSLAPSVSSAACPETQPIPPLAHSTYFPYFLDQQGQICQPRDPGIAAEESVRPPYRNGPMSSEASSRIDHHVSRIHMQMMLVWRQGSLIFRRRKHTAQSQGCRSPQI